MEYLVLNTNAFYIIKGLYIGSDCIFIITRKRGLYNIYQFYCNIYSILIYFNVILYKNYITVTIYDLFSHYLPLIFNIAIIYVCELLC